MEHILLPGVFGLGLILVVFFYTIYLVRTNRLSAHMAISWIIAEIAFLVMMLSESLRTFVRSFLGDQAAPYSLFLLGAVWIVFLMLESLTRISLLNVKLKEVNQELALTRERLDRAEEAIRRVETTFSHS